LASRKKVTRVVKPKTNSNFLVFESDVGSFEQMVYQSKHGTFAAAKKAAIEAGIGEYAPDAVYVVEIKGRAEAIRDPAPIWKE
jgi:hypothetical protein